MKLQQSGYWSIGLATHKTDLNKSKGGTDSESWCLNSDHIVLHDNKEIHKLSLQPADISSSLENINDILPGTNNETGIPNEGDTIGVAYDHVEMNFYLNGKKLDIPVLNIKGTVYPALFGNVINFFVVVFFFFLLKSLKMFSFKPFRDFSWRRSHFGYCVRWFQLWATARIWSNYAWAITSMIQYLTNYTKLPFNEFRNRLLLDN